MLTSKSYIWFYNPVVVHLLFQFVFQNLIFYNLVIHNHTIYTIRPLYVVMNIEQLWFIQLHKKSKQVIVCFLFHFARCDTRPNVAGGIWKWSQSKRVSTLIYTLVNIWPELPQRMMKRFRRIVCQEQQKNWGRSTEGFVQITYYPRGTMSLLRGCAFIAGDVREFSRSFCLAISFVFPKISLET